MKGFIVVNYTYKGISRRRLIAVTEIVSVLEDHNHAYIEFVKAKNGRAIYGLEVTETFEEICAEIALATEEKTA